MSNLHGLSPTISPNTARPHNGSNSTFRAQTMSSQPQHPYDQEKTYSSMFDKVLNARRQAGLGIDDFYTDEDVLNHSPNGWPRIAALQMWSKNKNSFRGFEPLTTQILTSLMLKISCIENRLDEMNFTDAEHDARSLKSLPFDRERFIANCERGVGHLPVQCSESAASELDWKTRRDNLYITCRILESEYFELLLKQHKIKKLPRISRLAHEAHFYEAKRTEGLDNEACAFMRNIDDFISTEPDYVFRRFESLLYSMNLCSFTMPLKYLCCLFSRRADPSNRRVAYSMRSIGVLFKAVLLLSGLSLLIPPVSILYLVEGWPRAAYLGVVVGSSVIFALVMVLFEASTERLLIGLTAYYAVLVAFLSNLPGVPGRDAMA